MVIKGESLIGGQAHGTALRLDAPISFWGGVNPQTSAVTLAGHPQEGMKISGKMLIIDRLIGSSSSSAVMLELLYNGIGPAALIIGTKDAILPVGALVAQQMQWSLCPVIIAEGIPFQSGDKLTLNDNKLTRIRTADAPREQ